MATDVHDHPGQHRYEVLVDATFAGFAAYRRRGGLIAFTHTEVDRRFAGRGIGTALIKGALDGARADGLDVLPFCAMVCGYVDRHREYVDLVPAPWRADFEL